MYGNGNKAREPLRQLPHTAAGISKSSCVSIGVIVVSTAAGLMFFPRRHHRREEAAVMHRGTEAVQCGEMLGYAIAFVRLETITGAILRQFAHQAVARNLGDDRGRRDREHQPVAADHGIALAGRIEPVAAIDEHVLGHFGQRMHRTLEAPTATRAEYCRDRSVPATRRRPQMTRSRKFPRTVPRGAPRSAVWNRRSLWEFAWDRAPQPRRPPAPPTARARPRRSQPPARRRA